MAALPGHWAATILCGYGRLVKQCEVTTNLKGLLDDAIAFTGQFAGALDQMQPVLDILQAGFRLTGQLAGATWALWQEGWSSLGEPALRAASGWLGGLNLDTQNFGEN